MPLTRRRTGWSLVDLMIALALVGILTGIALPAVRSARTRARAAQVQAHFSQLQLRIQQVCAATGACDDPQSATVFANATNGSTPDWLRDSLAAPLLFDQRATGGYLLEWVPVTGATTTASRVLGNCIRCLAAFPWFCSSTPIQERTTTVASYGQIAVVDVATPQSDLGYQMATSLGVVAQPQPTGAWANRWVFSVDPVAVKTIGRDTNPTRSAFWNMTCS
jgi:type II secretory pathway pseudopilin PulG